MRKNNLKKFIVNYRGAVLAVIVILLLFSITIGFAAYGELLTIGGNISIIKAGKVEITNISLLESNNISNANNVSYEMQNLSFDLTFNGGENTYAIYEVQLTNNSNLYYIYSGSEIEKNLVSSNLEDTAILNITYEDIESGLSIAPGESVRFKYKIEIANSLSESTYNVNINTDLNFTLNSNGNILATLNTTTVDLTDNKTATIEIEVINTYSYEKNFYLSQTNNNLILNDNENIKYTIPANTTQTYTITLKASSEAIFLSTSETTSIMMTPTYLSQMSVGDLTVSVDEYVAPDTEMPVVGNAVIRILDTPGEIFATWERKDTGGTSIVNYNLKLFNKSETIIARADTHSSSTTYTFTGVEPGTYYLVVSGEDEAGNNGLAYMFTSSPADGYATKSATVTFKWVFNITNSLRGLKSNGAKTANLNTSYTATLTPNATYNLPATIKIVMGGNTLTEGTQYTYSSSDGLITINNVTGDITITAEGEKECLVEGTKILLADNTYKNIEDIRYDDLLKIYSYEEGRFINVYPIWIEKKHSVAKYQLNTFSDGSILKTVGAHGIYDINKNLFVTVDNKDEFNLGTEVAIYDEKENKFKKVSVINIEQINEVVNYYHVVSTRYYDIIANNFLTTDGTTILSNLYGFNNNITWTSIRKDLMSNPNNLYKYEEFEDIMPYYMFKGLRVEEGKVLNNYGLTYEIFKEYLSKNQLNENLLLSPLKNKNNKRMWMVTTSDDIVINKNDYLVEEGTTYIVKEPIKKENFIAWYNTGTGEYHYPKDKIQIWFGTYLEAIYKE